MKKINLTILLIAVVVFISCVPVLASGLTDIGDSPNQTAISVLNGLNLINGYPDGTFRHKDYIKREEFVALVLRTLGYNEEILTSGNEYFSDVPADSWASKTIRAAYDIGLVEGYPDGTFGYGKNITLKECVKIVVSGMGYIVDPATSGDFATPYLQIANKDDFLDDVNMGEELATRGNVSQLLYNILDATILTSYDGTGIRHTAGYSGVTVLDNLHIAKGNGTITGVYGTKLNNSSHVIAKDEIEIDGKIYKCSIPDVSKYFGFLVYFYYDADEIANDPQIYVLEVVESEDTVIRASDILSESTLQRISWDENGKKKSRTIASNASFIYNGQRMTTAQLSDSIFSFDSGRVIIRESSSGDDIVIIESYESIVAVPTSRDRLNDLISDYYLEYELNDKQISYSFYLDGVEIDGPELYEADTILDIYVSLDGKSVRVEGCTDFFEGHISAINTTGKYTIESDGATKEYEITANFMKAISKNNPNAEALELGNDMTFYLNSNGEIAYAVLSHGSQNLQYGYLIDAKQKTGMSDIIYVQIMTVDNKFTEYEFATQNKIKFGVASGSTYSVNRADVNDIYAKIKPSGSIKRQVVQYALNDDGKINEFYLANSSADSENFSKDTSEINVTYSNGLLEERYVIDEDTVVFHIPNLGKYIELYRAGKALDYFASGSVYPSILYDVDDMHVGAIEIKGTEDTYFNEEDGNEFYVDIVNSPVMLVDTVGSEMSSDGSIYKVIKGYVGKKYVTQIISDSYSSGAFHPGVVVQYQTNGKQIDRAYYSDKEEVLASYVVLADLEDTNIEHSVKWNYKDLEIHNASMCTTVGTVKQKSPGLVYVETYRNGSYVSIPYTIGGGATVIEYDLKTNKSTILKEEDISVGDLVFIRQRYNNVREIILVR